MWVQGLAPDRFLGNHSHMGAEHTFVGSWRYSDDGTDVLVGTPETWQEVDQAYTAKMGEEFLDDNDEPLALGSSAPLGKSPKENWVDEVGGLPRYVREVARELMKKRGMTMSRAIATAISRIKMWAATSKNPKTKAKAAKAIAEWEAKKAKAHLSADIELAESFVADGGMIEDPSPVVFMGDLVLTPDQAKIFSIPPAQMSLAEAREYRRLNLALGTWREALHPRSHGKFAKKGVDLDNFVSLQARKLGSNRDLWRKRMAKLMDMNVPDPVIEKILKQAGMTESKARRSMIEGVRTEWEERRSKKTKVSKAAATLRARDAFAGFSESPNNNKGEEVNVSEDTATTKETKPDDQQEILMAELADLRKRVREGEVDKKIAKLQDDGYTPAFCKEVKSILMADDGAPVLQLSEEEGEPTLSLSDVIDRLVEALPKPDVKLAEQHHEGEDHNRPADEEVTKKTTAEKAQEVAESIGDSRYLAATKK
jgi:hypothetical protein